VHGGRPSSIFVAYVNDAFDERGIRQCERVAVDPNIVLKSGAAMAAEFQ
jgi:hypothetical protein